MKRKSGFTLVELMIVILIVGILAAVVLVYLRGHTSAAKWTEGKSMIGSVATAIRCYQAERGIAADPPTSMTDDLGLRASDFEGAYFSIDNYSFEVTSMNPLTFTITATHPTLRPSGYVLDQNGVLTEVE